MHTSSEIGQPPEVTLGKPPDAGYWLRPGLLQRVAAPLARIRLVLYRFLAAVRTFYHSYFLLFGFPLGFVPPKQWLAKSHCSHLIVQSAIGARCYLALFQQHFSNHTAQLVNIDGLG